MNLYKHTGQKSVTIYEIQNRSTQLLTVLLNIWEDSVQATHLFLSCSEVNQIKKYVPQALNNVEHLVATENECGETVAFMGVENNRLEMLFISPLKRGKGIGRQLLQYGIQNYKIQEVTVNEQNP